VRSDSNCKCRRPLRLVPFDDDLDGEIVDPSADRIEQGLGYRYHASVESTRDIMADLAEQFIHVAATVAVELEPNSGCRWLCLDSGKSLFNWQSGPNAKAMSITSCNEEALAAGENLALLGSEIFQFGNVDSLGDGRFRLSKLLRGRGGTEWACAAHDVGDRFCLIRPGTLQAIILPIWSLGATISASADGGAIASTQLEGEALRPPSPVNLTAQREPNGDLSVAWTRRSRQGFAWVDGIDAPLGEAREQYRVVISGSQDGLESSVDEPAIVIADAVLSDLGIGPALIEVRQVGDLTASRPAQISINLS
jgi:hypothetical protein